MKYNDNGTYKDIYVKTFDTLPVGAIVEFDGQTIPDGWTDIGNNKIKKISQFVSGEYQVNGAYSTSQNEAYSCEYINKIGTQKNGFGDLLTTDGTYTANYYAKAVATKIGSKLWRIETEGQILNNNSGGSYYNWGVSIDKINTLLGLALKTNNQTENTSIYDYFTNGSRNEGINGIATKFEYKSNVKALLPARIYNSSGASGGWGLDTFANGSILKTVIYLEESE